MCAALDSAVGELKYLVDLDREVVAYWFAVGGVGCVEWCSVVSLVA